VNKEQSSCLGETSLQDIFCCCIPLLKSLRSEQPICNPHYIWLAFSLVPWGIWAARQEEGSVRSCGSMGAACEQHGQGEW